ncbi:MAG: helix-turn-helix domain-containing protein [Terriglobia bacterium]
MRAKLTTRIPPEEFRRLLGKRIRERRTQLGTHQMAFAIANGFHPSMLSRIETGLSDMTLQRASDLARALGWTLEEMMEGLL